MESNSDCSELSCVSRSVRISRTLSSDLSTSSTRSAVAATSCQTCARRSLAATRSSSNLYLSKSFRTVDGCATSAVLIESLFDLNSASNSESDSVDVALAIELTSTSSVELNQSELYSNMAIFAPEGVTSGFFAECSAEVTSRRCDSCLSPHSTLLSTDI